MYPLLADSIHAGFHFASCPIPGGHYTELLLSNNKNARAFALAHLASEELVKFNLLLPVALELARDHSIDWKKLVSD